MWGLLVLLLGILYGVVTPGRANKMRLFLNGVMIGLVVAILFALLGGWSGKAPLGIGSGLLGIVLDAIVLSLLFVLGAFIGDWFDSTRRTRARN